MRAKEVTKRELPKEEEPICKIKTLRELAEEQNSKWAKEMLENPILTKEEFREITKRVRRYEEHFPFDRYANCITYEDVQGTDALIKSIQVMMHNIKTGICEKCPNRYSYRGAGLRYCDMCTLGVAKKVVKLELDHAKQGGIKI